jgi:site-specific recombinase XerD
VRLRALIVVLCRAGLRIGEALALSETDLDARRGAVLIRAGKTASVARWGWTAGGGSSWPWRQLRVRFTVGPLFCVIHGPTGGGSWEPASARRQLGRTAAAAGVRRRFAPHQLRHAHAIEMAHDGVPLVVIQRQLGHAHLGVTSIYLQGIDNAEIIDAVHARRPPMIPATAGLRTTL